MTHELDTYAKFRRAAARATDIRAEQDAAATLRETAARLQPAAPATGAAAISPALAAALSTADRSMAAAPPRPTTAAMTKTPPASSTAVVPVEIKTCAAGRALGLTNDQRAAAAATVEQWRPGELQRANGLTRVETEFGRWAVLRRDALGNVSAFDFIRA